MALKMSRAARRVGMIGDGLLTLVVALLALSVLGTFVPAIPYLSPGQLVTAFFGPWVIIIAIAVAGLSFWRWRRGCRRRHIGMAACAILAAFGATVIVSTQVAAIRASGATIDLAEALGLMAAAPRGPAAEIHAYGRFAGKNIPLAVYRPARKRAHPAPVLVYVHGGGWISGDYRQRDHDLYWFAAHGVLVVSVEYPLSTADRHLWAVTEGQIGCALAWIGENIGRYGGDPVRVAMIGESAGGNLVLDVAYRASQHQLSPACPGAMPRVAAVVAMYPVIDVAGFWRNDGWGAPFDARQMASYYTGGTPGRVPERYAAVSPVTHISTAAPATVLIVGARDRLVPPAPADAFARGARAAGVDAKLVSVPYAGHAFDFISGSVNNQLTRDTTMRLLTAHGMKP